MTEPGKICTACRTWKPLTGYYRNVAARDGLLSACKACHGERKRVSEERAAAARDAPPQTAPVRTKTCNVCNKRRLVTEYHSHRGTSDGLGGTCKTCERRRYQQTKKRALSRQFAGSA